MSHTSFSAIPAFTPNRGQDALSEGVMPSILAQPNVPIAWEIASSCASMVEGLIRRYPLAWMNREQFPYYRHLYFRDDDLMLEVRRNMAYCLLEEAKQDSALYREVYEMLNRKYPMANRFHKGKKRISMGSAFATWLDPIMRKDDVYTMEVASRVALMDFFVLHHGFDYLECPKGGTLSDNYVDGMKGLVGMSQRLRENERTSLTHVKDSAVISPRARIELLQQTDYYFRAKVEKQIEEYEAAQGMPLHESLNFYLSSKESFADRFEPSSVEYALFFWLPYQGFSSIGDSQNCLTKEDAFTLFAHAMLLFADYKGSVLIKENDSLGDSLPNHLTRPFKKFLDETLKMLVTPYLLTKAYEETRDKVFDYVQGQDVARCQTAEHQLTELSKELKQLKEQELAMKVLVQKANEQVEARIKKETKALQQSLTKETAISQKLRLELEAVKAERDALKQTCESYKTALDLSESQQKERLSLLNTPLPIDDTVLFVGGSPNLVKKMKQKWTQCRYFELDETVSDDYLTGSSCVFVLVEMVNHPMVRRAIDASPSARVSLVTATNLNRIEQQVQSILQEEQQRAETVA